MWKTLPEFIVFDENKKATVILADSFEAAAIQYAHRTELPLGSHTFRIRNDQGNLEDVIVEIRLEYRAVCKDKGC